MFNDREDRMNYVRNAWYVAAWSPDLLTDQLTAAQILGEPIVLWRSAHLLYDTQGQCVQIPGQDVIPPGARVRSYPVIPSAAWR
jgi:phenylpropionate dioxygenase-like ring-hydroxylating dioxygenase large terminal subunit